MYHTTIINFLIFIFSFVQLRPNNAASVIFLITATSVGEIDLIVEADNMDGEYDKVHHKLPVKVRM